MAELYSKGHRGALDGGPRVAEEPRIVRGEDEEEEEACEKAVREPREKTVPYPVFEASSSVDRNEVGEDGEENEGLPVGDVARVPAEERCARAPRAVRRGRIVNVTISPASAPVEREDASALEHGAAKRVVHEVVPDLRYSARWATLANHPQKESSKREYWRQKWI